MARAMNVEKRVEALKAIRARTESHSKKARRIADELESSFKGQKSPRAKSAFKMASRARTLSKALNTVADISV